MVLRQRQNLPHHAAAPEKGQEARDARCERRGATGRGRGGDRRGEEETVFVCPDEDLAVILPFCLGSFWLHRFLIARIIIFINITHWHWHRAPRRISIAPDLLHHSPSRHSLALLAFTHRA